MAHIDASERDEPALDAKGLRFGIVVARFNSRITKNLLAGALSEIKRHGGRDEDQTVAWVPGGFEVPFGVKILLDKGGFDGIITLGCILKGMTTHNEYIAREAAHGIAQLSLQYNVPVSFGVLTPDTLEQAVERSGAGPDNKGAEAAQAVIEMALLKRSFSP